MSTKTVEVLDRGYTAFGPLPRVKVTLSKAPWEK